MWSAGVECRPKRCSIPESLRLQSIILKTAGESSRPVYKASHIAWSDLRAVSDYVLQAVRAEWHGPVWLLLWDRNNIVNSRGVPCPDCRLVWRAGSLKEEDRRGEENFRSKWMRGSTERSKYAIGGRGGWRPGVPATNVGQRHICGGHAN